MRTIIITIYELLQESLDLTVNMNKRHVDVQIMRVIIQQANQNAVSCYTRSNQQHEVRFNLFIFYCVVTESSSLVYIMMTTEMNGRIFHQDLVLHDNGVIIIGSYLHVLAPHQIDRNMQGIPLIRTDYPDAALCPPLYLLSAWVNTDI